MSLMRYRSNSVAPTSSPNREGSQPTPPDVTSYGTYIVMLVFRFPDNRPQGPRQCFPIILEVGKSTRQNVLDKVNDVLKKMSPPGGTKYPSVDPKDVQVIWLLHPSGRGFVDRLECYDNRHRPWPDVNMETLERERSFGYWSLSDMKVDADLWSVLAMMRKNDRPDEYFMVNVRDPKSLNGAQNVPEGFYARAF